jgi:catechol 2,3-dioxygenase-like lactoylglutathione lyase family enzyme
MADPGRLSVLALDHVNIRTTRLAELVSFYGSVLGLTSGPRPPFGFPGAWLYAGDRPVVHLVQVAPTEAPPAAEAEELRLSHFAFRAEGLEALLERLGAAGVRYQAMALPGADITQVHFADPDGNALHVDVAGERH